MRSDAGVAVGGLAPGGLDKAGGGWGGFLHSEMLGVGDMASWAQYGFSACDRGDGASNWCCPGLFLALVMPRGHSHHW